MENTLVQFISTLDALLKKTQLEMGNAIGVSNLTISQLQYIEAIHSLEHPTPTDVAGKMKVSGASATTAIKKLSSLGYLEKIPSTADKREIHVRLTEEGLKLVEAKENAIKKYLALIQATLEKDELIRFNLALTKIIAQFSQL